MRRKPQYKSYPGTTAIISMALVSMTRYSMALAFLLCVILTPGYASSIPNNPDSKPDTKLSPKQKVIAVNLAGIGIISAWGIRYWNYADFKPHVTSEAWFGQNTKHGGADKLGHFYAGYAIANVFAKQFQDWGYSRKHAALYSSLSSSLITGYMEVGDAYSEFGFSKQDFIMNIAGTLTSYALYIHPELAKKINIRAEYIPTGTTNDPITDYDGMKYLIAMRLDGFDKTARSPLRFFELQLGYYTRGYENKSPHNRQRNIYTGIGLNVSHLMRRIGWTRTAYTLEYIQVPLTYIEQKTTLDK